jgi:hypothetical protein
MVAKVQPDIFATNNNPLPSSAQVPFVSYDINFGSGYVALLSFPDIESTSYFANATLTVSSNVTLAGSAAATLTITGSRTAFSDAKRVMGDAVAILTYNGQSVKFAGSNTGTASGTLTITNPNGVKLVLSGDASNLKGNISVNSSVVGTIERNGKGALIYYTDGTFESIN